MNVTDLRITAIPRSGGVVVRLEGALTERVELRQRFQQLSGAIVFDLKAITKITSFGVREWISALAELWKCHYAFIHCPPPMMTQFSVVSGFAGNGELVSFFAPYHCGRCGEDSAQLVDLRRAVPPFAPLQIACVCGGQAELNEIPEQFFSYASSRPNPRLSPDLEQLVQSEMGGGSEATTIRKEVSGQVTAVWLGGVVNEHSSFKRPLENVEGFVWVDFSGVTAVTAEGLRQLQSTLAGLDVRYLGFADVRTLVVPMVAAMRLPFPSAIISVLRRGTCASCNERVDFELTHVELRTRPGASVPSSPVCPSCGALHALESASDLANIAPLVAREIPAELIEYRRASAGRPPPEPKPRANSSPRGVRLAPTPPQIELGSFVGENPAMKSIMETVHRVAASDATVLIRGETGTGKEMIARLVHALSPRRAKMFLAVSCAALAPGVMESELFGHERGAFTGAVARQAGRFERAHGGTLLIDEVGDMPLEVQVKVLRAIQEHYVERIGGTEQIPVDIRLVAATHRPLEEMMRSGAFREDLFYRLNVIPIVVPPLRERREDIWPLSVHYLLQIQQRWGKTGIRFSDEMRRALESYAWPGNVRELINVVERTVAMTPSNELARVVDFAAGSTEVVLSQADPAASDLKRAVREYEKNLIATALANAGGNRTHAAKVLRISRQALGMKLTKYKLS